MTAPTMAEAKRAYAAAVARFKAYPRCSICGGAMICGQPGAHYSCREAAR